MAAKPLFVGYWWCRLSPVAPQSPHLPIGSLGESGQTGMRTESYVNGQINAQTKGPSKPSTIEASYPLPRTNPARAAGQEVGIYGKLDRPEHQACSYQRKRSSFTTFVFRRSSTSEQIQDFHRCTSSPFGTPAPAPSPVG
ncbi:MAG: hypothetical protein LBC30_02530 [Puniceicoccales bacterium]|nr:hypothetical protein [Puniceicoccales bacterium]